VSPSLKVSIKPPSSSTTPLSQSAQGLIFVIAMWLISRIVIIIAMQVLAPLYPGIPAEHPLPVPLSFTPGFVPKPSWDLFTHWDAAWYEQIVTQGYDYADDGEMHNIAFFPLFPILVRSVMALGIPFVIAGFLVNNLALLGAMILLYRWADERHGVNAARWATAVMAWCPFSLFGTVVYTEGLFLLLSTAALRAFEKQQYVRAGLWGALTTATRVTGVALIPTFLLVAWRERRPVTAYVAGLAVGLGLLAYMVYCAIHVGDPLAFVHVQKAWGTASGVNWKGWLDTFLNMFQLRFGAIKEMTKVVMVFGGVYLFWHLRSQLSRVAVIYGFCSLAIIINSGAIMSVNRYVYGIAPASLAFGLLLSRYPRWGYAIMGFFGVVLVGFTVRFSWWRFIA
jgi:Gpi18-like mannosyltransferase